MNTIDHIDHIDLLTKLDTLAMVTKLDIKLIKGNKMK
jgi:hypothetical protein